MTDPDSREEPPRTLQEDMQLELYKLRIVGTKDFLAGALRAGITLNGGAAVAILAFLGSVWGDQASGVPDLRDTMFYFLLGLAFGGFAFLSIFIGQWRATCLQRDGKIPEHDKWLTFSRIISVTLLILSMSMFVVGAWSGANAISA